MICKNKKSELEEFFLEFEYTVCYVSYQWWLLIVINSYYVSRRSNIDH